MAGEAAGPAAVAVAGVDLLAAVVGAPVRALAQEGADRRTLAASTDAAVRAALNAAIYEPEVVARLPALAKGLQLKWVLEAEGHPAHNLGDALRSARAGMGGAEAAEAQRCKARADRARHEPFQLAAGAGAGLGRNGPRKPAGQAWSRPPGWAAAGPAAGAPDREIWDEKNNLIEQLAEAEEEFIGPAAADDEDADADGTAGGRGASESAERDQDLVPEASRDAERGQDHVPEAEVPTIPEERNSQEWKTEHSMEQLELACKDEDPNLLTATGAGGCNQLVGNGGDATPLNPKGKKHGGMPAKDGSLPDPASPESAVLKVNSQLLKSSRFSEAQSNRDATKDAPGAEDLKQVLNHSSALGSVAAGRTFSQPLDGPCSAGEPAKEAGGDLKHNLNPGLGSSNLCNSPSRAASREAPGGPASLMDLRDRLMAGHSKKELLALARRLEPGLPKGAVPKGGPASMCKAQLAALVANWSDRGDGAT